MNFITTDLPGSIIPILKSIRSAIPSDLPVYLVGGAVRDLLLHRDVHDLDFVIPNNALDIARTVAAKFGAAFYPLDKERETGRVIWMDPSGKRWHLDFAVYRDSDLTGDLIARDLTINAIAIDITPPMRLIDPVNGAADLLAKQLRACTPGSFKTDPVRILRAVRIATTYNFRILPETLQSMREVVINLEDVSPERLRDEIFRILDSHQTATSIRVLDKIGGLNRLFPELEPLRDLAQSTPHITDAWNHTLDVISKLEQVLSVLAEEYDPESASNLYAGMIALRIGRYRQHIHSKLLHELSEGRSIRSLLFFAALYHDIGKPETQQRDDAGRIRFFDHDKVGTQIIARRGEKLRLSNLELSWLSRAVRHHMRPGLLAQSEGHPSRRAIYRFFRDAQDAGVEVCILSLADVWGTYGPSLPQQVWEKQIEVVRALLEAWWEKPDEIIYPALLINGHELMEEFSLQPGPIVGRLLEEIREAMADGVIHDRDQALSLARSILEGEDFPKG